MRPPCVPLLLAAAFMAGAGAVQGQAPPVHPSSRAEPAPLTLEAAVQAALQHSPLLRAAVLEAQARGGALEQAGARLNPALGIEQEDLRREARVTTVQISQTFELGGKRAARQAVARGAHDAALAELAGRRAEVRAGAIQAFFDALIAQQRVAVAEAALGTTARGVDAATRRVAAGKVSPTEETRAHVAQANARIELIQAEAERRTAERSLAVVTGLPSARPAPGDDAPLLPALPSDETLAERLARAPVLQRARAESASAEATVALERARAVPDVTVGIGARHAQELGRSQPVISISVPLPLFDTHRGAQHEALRRRDAAQLAVQAEEQRLRLEVLQAIDQLQARRSEAQALHDEVLPGAQAAFEAASRGFELGKFAYIDVLDAQRTWLQARVQYLQALAQGHRAAIEIERRLGAPDTPRARGAAPTP